MRGLGGLLELILLRVLGSLKWLSIPICLLLFLQWPLREVVHGFSREANDIGQLLFAVYVAASVTAATLAGTHLAADALARRYSARVRRAIITFGQCLALAPWSVFALISARQMILSSAKSLERFPDTGNAGYFVIKLSLWVLCVGILLTIVLDLLGGPEGNRRP
jgi:TRAP-type mannitol/chloroaromatic compound transport system permease small subunit